MEELVRSLGKTGGHTVLLADTVESNGGFVVHYLLAKLFSQTNTRVVLLGLMEPYTHYSRIARKQGCNLQQWRDKGRFVFLGLSSEVFASGGRDSQEGNESTFGENAVTHSVVTSPLAALYSRIRDAAKGMLGGEKVRDDGAQTCIIVDDLSVLDVLAGGSQNNVLDFVHYCKALMCGKQRCSVVVLTHQDVHEEAGDLYAELELEYLSSTVIRVEPLSTGLAADVHGQLTILRRAGHSGQDQRSAAQIPFVQKFQFRILENNVQFFLPGSYEDTDLDCLICILDSST